MNRKVPVYWLLLALVIPIVICYYLVLNRPVVVAAEEKPCDVYNSITNYRMQNYEFARPLLYYDVTSEDYRLAALKSRIETYIESKKHDNALTVASVYLRKGGGWFSINKDEQFKPASMQKVPIMITYLKDAEKNPSLLDKSLYFDRHFGELPKQNVKVFSLQEHKNYPIRELLKYMIAYSDNDALNLLYQNMNNNTFRQLFVDLNLPVPDLEKDNYTIDVMDYAKFFRVLINATYLNNDLSELALKMLSESTYQDGIARNLGKDVKIAHKFGERGEGNVRELHEFGIIYKGRRAYILGIMTRGRDFKELSDVLAGISDIVAADNTPDNANSFQGKPMATSVNK